MAPANAQKNQNGNKLASASQTSGEARFKALTTYVDCKKLVVELGWADWEGWYGCNARNFKK